MVRRVLAVDLRVRERRRRDVAAADEEEREAAPLPPLLLVIAFTAVPRRTRRLARFSTPLRRAAGDAPSVALANAARVGLGTAPASPQSSAMDRRMARSAARRDAVCRACITSGVVVDTLPAEPAPASGLLADQSAGEAGTGVAGDAAARSAEDPRALLSLLRDLRSRAVGVRGVRALRDRDLRPALYGVHSGSLGDAAAPRLRCRPPRSRRFTFVSGVSAGDWADGLTAVDAGLVRPRFVRARGVVRGDTLSLARRVDDTRWGTGTGSGASETVQ